MSELDRAWELADSIADEINASGNLMWAAHLRASIQMSKSLEREKQQLQATSKELLSALDGVMSDVGKSLTQDRYDQVQKAITNAKQVMGDSDE